MERLDNNFQENNLISTEQNNKLENEINALKQSIHQQEELLNETKLQLINVQNEKDDRDKELGNNKQTIDGLELRISQLSAELNQKVIQRNNFIFIIDYRFCFVICRMNLLIV